MKQIIDTNESDIQAYATALMACWDIIDEDSLHAAVAALVIPDDLEKAVCKLARELYYHRAPY
jgi:hypothetical protein